MNVREKGVTLVEVMIALVVLLIVFMGLIQASLLTTTVNVRNQVRDEGVRIAADTMTRLRQLNFTNADLGDTDGGFGDAFTSAGAPDAFALDPTLKNVNSPGRYFRNLKVTYKVEKAVEDLGNLGVNKNVTVRVSWKYQGTTFTHTIMTTLRSPSA